MSAPRPSSASSRSPVSSAGRPPRSSTRSAPALLVRSGPATLPDEPELAYEYSDALHMASLTCIATGDLAAALGYGEQRFALPFHREEGHLATSRLLVVTVMTGDWTEAVGLAEGVVTRLNLEFPDRRASAGSVHAALPG